MRQRVPAWFRKSREVFVAGNRVRLLRDGVEAFPAMLEAIAEARRQILLEMYWFGSDRVGWRFAEALIAARARGVEVALLYDSLGSFEADERLFAELRSAGVLVVEYNPLAPWKKRFRLARLSIRDHRKLLVVDGWIGFTGGINIADQWLPFEEEGGGFRDHMAVVQGPAVAGFVDAFVNTWSAEGGPKLKLTWTLPPLAPGNQKVRVLAQYYLKNRREIGRAYLYHLYRARRRAWIVNSYFVPDLRLVRALTRAADRGVDVRVLVPGRSDIEIVRHAGRAVWGRLLRHGVRIFEWHKSTLHAKSAVIDGYWSTIGTFNFDYLSLFSNLEINLSVQDEAFGEELERSLAQDFEEAREVTLLSHRYRPLSHRLLEFLLYGFRRFL